MTAVGAPRLLGARPRALLEVCELRMRARRRRGRLGARLASPARSPAVSAPARRQVRDHRRGPAAPAPRPRTRAARKTRHRRDRNPGEKKNYPLVTWSSVAPSFTPNSCPAWIARFRRS